MRWRRLSWVGLGLLGLAIFLRLQRVPTVGLERAALTTNLPTRVTPAPSLHFSSTKHESGPFAYRLSNTTKTVAQLARSQTGILLENALLDTSEPLQLDIPAALRSASPSGSYIVQSRGPFTVAFRSRLEQVGATVVSYIPNNAFLIRASDSQAQILAREPDAQAVLPYEPYYKLKPSVLTVVLSSEATPEAQTQVCTANVLLFTDAREATQASLKEMGLQSTGDATSPFGPVLRVQASVSILPALARLPGVQEIEFVHRPAPANDLSRAALGVSPDSASAESYLGLTGTNVVVNVNDTGVDAGQADLLGRVLSDLPNGSSDTNGHGTHVAGIIAGSGAQSLTVTNAPGSPMPPAAFQFRGKAPAATVFSMAVALNGGPASNAYLQQTAAATNVFISNNSWLYDGDMEYDLAAASFDAASRDALPGVSGPQPLLFVFPAGNHGGAGNDGEGGIPGMVQSPATAKNVITVGAIEQPRFMTNETWTCATNGTCTTNSPWFPLTDSSNQIAAFSARGNVGIGIEGENGRFKPDVVAPGTFIISTRSSQWNQTAYYTQTNNELTATPDANYFEVLSNLNDSMGPFYCFESGTSLAAADTSGLLALMQDFFQNRLNQTNSPALMKALLINGARPLGGNYDLHTSGPTNAQGWGLVNLTNSLPAALTNTSANSQPMFLFEQTPEGSLATGQSRTRIFSLSPAALNKPLRVTLAWTDPPGNPVAGLKLVNDLDLLVTNLQTGEVYFGNDIPSGQVFNQPWDTNSPPNSDFVNNVENVFLAPPLAGSYSVTVVGRRVNVNAVSANTNDLVQDYAMVVASANGQIEHALTLTDAPPVAVSAPLVTTLTNAFLLSAVDVGSVLVHERVGANPLWPATNTVSLPGLSNAVITLGLSNQWHFYVLSNSAGFTNAAFATFQATRIAEPLPAFGSNNSEADIDLYVSLDPALTNLDPGAIAAADKSLGRGGNETLIYSNAQAAVYYIGVKCESQGGAEYGFLNVFSAFPLGQSDAAGNQVLRGVSMPSMIPGGSSNRPGIGNILGLSAQPMMVRRVVVTNVLTAASAGDLAGSLVHQSTVVGLNNHATNGPVFQQAFIYDDSGEGDMPGGQPPDGPGSLRDFAGQNAVGQWRLTMLDTNQPATNDDLSIFLELEPDLTASIMPTILNGACRQDYVFVPLTATNLTATASLVSGTGPVSVELCPMGVAPNDCLTLTLSAAGASVTLVNDATTHPTLSSGFYVLRICNLGPDPATVSVIASIASDPNGPVPVSYVSSARVPLPDDALTSSTMLVTNKQPIEAVSVGVRIEHARVSDLVLRLVSPEGKRVLLSENRGGASTNGMGCDVLTTNRAQISYTGGPEAVTNIFDTGEPGGLVTLSYDFYSLPDEMTVYYEGALIYDSGFVSNAGTTNLVFGPGASTILTIVMNQGGNPNPNTAWYYSVSSAHFSPEYLTFVEDTNLFTTPIKFAQPPLSVPNYSGNGVTNAIFYQPEEPLTSLVGRSAFGPWTLEVTDNRAGATDPPPALANWKLDFIFHNTRPLPLPLTQGQPATNLLGSGQLQWFTVQVPGWASFATNALLNATAPVNLWYSSIAPPTGTNAGDVPLLLGSTSGSSTLRTNGSPALASVYYLAVENTNTAAVTFALQIDFDQASVPTLQSGVPYANTNAGPPHPVDYYRYVVSTNAVRAQFEINGPSADLTLVLRRGLPLPNASTFDYRSANPDTNDELIVLYDYSSPVPLTPGDWFLGVVNTSGAPATYSVMATEFPAYGTNLLLLTPVASTNSFCLTWDSLPGIHYFVQGKTSLNDTQWVTLTPTLTATDISTTYCVSLPSRFHFFRVHEGLVLVPPPLVISSIGLTNGGMRLSWPASTNSQFHVQWTSSLNPPAWSDFTNVLTSTNGVFSFFDDGSQTGGAGHTRFYRLVQLP